MGATAHADTVVETNPQPTTDQPANVVDTQPVSAASGTQSTPAVNDTQSAATTNNTTPISDVNADSAPAMLPKQPANTVDTHPAEAANQVSPFMNLAVESDNNDLTPKRETVDSQWIIHYVNQADHKQELKDPTVITLQYTRTNTSQRDGTTKYGDWSYVPGSLK